MPSIGHYIIKFFAWIIKLITPKRELMNIERHRRGIERGSKFLKRPGGCTYEPFMLKHMKAEWIRPDNADSKKAILWIHGGGYSICSINTHRRMAAKLAKHANISVLLFEYRLAPESVFPAALDDSVMAYKYLLDEGYAPEHISFVGDSAGGGLSLATLLEAKDQDIPLPKLSVLIAPWCDLEGIGPSHTENEKTDGIIENWILQKWGLLYAGKESELTNPKVSPIYADLSGMPELYITVSTAEVLYSDSITIYENAKKAGVPATLRKWDHLIHVFQVYDRLLPEARQSLKEMGEFIKERLS